MYRGFNLDLNWYDEEYYTYGVDMYNRQKESVKETLDNFLLSDGSLDGSKMQSNWFPSIDADIFISHSHNDGKKAIALAYWLHENFNLSTFIDSCIWGYNIDLLKSIDNAYCKLSDRAYSYNRRNYSTSHVHTMLSSALIMMIDKAECLFFLNTPESITTDEVISQTQSPWIYSEIAISKYIRKKPIQDYRKRLIKKAVESKKLYENLKITYELDIEHLTDISSDDLDEWQDKWGKNPTLYNCPLDMFYKLNP